MAEETVHRTSGEEKSEEVIEEKGGGRSKRVRRVETTEGRSRRDRREELTIVDMGKKSRKAVRDLRKGKGRLMDEIEDTIEELRDAGAIAETAHPVVVIVERRVTDQGGMFSVFLPPGISGMLPMAMRRDEDDEDEDDEDD